MEAHEHEWFTQCCGEGGHYRLCAVPGCTAEEYEGPCKEAGTWPAEETE